MNGPEYRRNVTNCFHSGSEVEAKHEENAASQQYGNILVAFLFGLQDRKVSNVPKHMVGNELLMAWGGERAT